MLRAPTHRLDGILTWAASARLPASYASELSGAAGQDGEPTSRQVHARVRSLRAGRHCLCHTLADRASLAHHWPLAWPARRRAAPAARARSARHARVRPLRPASRAPRPLLPSQAKPSQLARRGHRVAGRALPVPVPAAGDPGPGAAAARGHGAWHHGRDRSRRARVCGGRHACARVLAAADPRAAGPVVHSCAAAAAPPAISGGGLAPPAWPPFVPMLLS